MAEVILIVDDDPDISAHLVLALQLEGYEVRTARDGREALAVAHAVRPDLILLDVNMPLLDGYATCRALRADAATASVPVIMLTSRSETEDKVAGFAAGADDYVGKPYDVSELLARVQGMLRRTSQLRNVSPLTGLPGNFEIARALDALINKGTTGFAVLYADLDNFKAFNDHYGFMRGDEAIKFTADTLVNALHDHPSAVAFAGHVGGDDFVLLCAPDDAEVICVKAIAAFDAGVGRLYDTADHARGYIEVADRQGTLHRYPIMTISIGGASTAQRPIATQWEASAIATEMKGFAKRHDRSAYELDRRRE